MIKGTQNIYDFHEEQAEWALSAFHAAILQKDFFLAAMNCAQVFEQSLMCGLILWRQMKNPTKDLMRAVETISSGVQQLGEFAPSGDLICEELPIEKALIISYLLGREEGPQVCSDLHRDRIPDLLLGSALYAPTPDVAWCEQFEVRVSKLRSGASRASYKFYGKMIVEGGSQAALLESESAWQARSSDKLYMSAFQSEGGDKTIDL